jgi:NADPH2:quinone reductase
MQAAYIHKTGGPENIVVGSLPNPQPAGGQVLVKVAAAAVNPIDTYVRSGMVPAELPLPFIVGCDLAGTVAALGPSASGRFQIGDRVWGSNQGLLGRQGTFAEYAAVDECWLYPTPPEVSDEAAAAGALVGITAHLGLVRDAQIRKGETLFVSGGTGGVGSTVVQMAKALGARVITTGSTDEKLAACRQLGADLAVNYQSENVADRIREFAPQGVNVWWETIREPDFDRAFGLMAERGRMILMAGREARPQFPVGPFYVNELRLFGFVMFKATPEEQRAAAEDISRWLASGEYRPRIDRVSPLSETPTAHRLQEESTVGRSGALAGKIVVRIAPS